MLNRILVIGCLLATAVPPVRQPSACAPPVWGETATAFAGRVNAYVELRDRLEGELSRRTVTANVAEVMSAQQTLAGKIRKARAKARQGDLFSSGIATEIRKSLRLAIDAHTWKIIMDDNPGEQPSQVNDVYRDGSPVTTMLPNVLAALPRLPEDLEYRFVEHHLILLDTRAMIIVDRIAFAIDDPEGQGRCR